MRYSALRSVAFGSAGIGVLVLVLVVLLPTGAGASAAPTLFASPTGAGAGCTQAQPCSLATALSAATEDAVLYLAEGTYTGSGAAVIALITSTTVYGGWDGAPAGEVACDPDAHPTVVDGQAQRRGVFANGVFSVTLDGFTVTNGASPQGIGGGLYAEGIDLTLRAMRFYSNVVDVYDDPETSTATGGGAYVQGGSLVASDSRFVANSAWGKTTSVGGGLAIDSADEARLERCLFEANDAWVAGALSFAGRDMEHNPLVIRESRFVNNGRGDSAGRARSGYSGAMQISNAFAILEDNTISGSHAANDHGAMEVAYSELAMARNTVTGSDAYVNAAIRLGSVTPFTLTNNIIANNAGRVAALTPAIDLSHSSGLFTHNTIARNGGSYAIALSYQSDITLTNNIVVSHTVAITASDGCTVTMDATLWGAEAWANDSETDGAGVFDLGAVNVRQEPEFRAPDAGNYHLAAHSPAIDAGVDADVSDDIDGDARPLEAGYDIGADEWTGRWYVHVPLALRR